MRLSVGARRKAAHCGIGLVVCVEAHNPKNSLAYLPADLAEYSACVPLCAVAILGERSARDVCVRTGKDDVSGQARGAGAS